MRFTLTLSALFLFLLSVHATPPDRSGSVAERIAASRANGTQFRSVELLDLLPPTPATDTLWRSACTSAEVLAYDQVKASRLIAEAPEHLALQIPSATGALVLLLEKVQIGSDGFIMSTSSGRSIEHRSLHYRGSIGGTLNTLVSVSIFEEELMAIISDRNGERIIGRFDRNTDGLHVFYHEDALRARNNAVCHTPDPGLRLRAEQLSINEGQRTARCVGLYWEVAHDIVLNKGSVANATNYITGLFNQMATLYDNDGIDVVLSELFVWDTPSPYNANSSSGRLYAFGDLRTSFNGDLAHLIDLGGYGGVAWVGTLCASSYYRMAYSGINSSYQNVPTYSWSVEVVTHEQGHNLGSPHTHNCSWNGNNTAIDGCGPAAGYTEGSCAIGPVPSSAVGGTIMSYCHLTGAGINFANGFGPQPTALIVNNVNNANCLSICGSDCAPPLSSVSIAGTTATITWANMGAISYDLQWKPSSSGTWTTVNDIAGTSHVLNGLTIGTSYDYRLRSDCSTETSDWSATASFTVPVPCTDQYEPNGSIANATLVQLPVALNALIGTTSDKDYFSFTTDQPSNISISLSNLAGDYDIQLLEPDGDQLGLSQNGGSQPEYIYLPNAPAATYIIYIYGWNGAHSTSICYSLNISSTGNQNCLTPEGLNGYGTSTTTALTQWQAVQGASTYGIQWRVLGEQEWSSIDGIASTEQTLNGLDQNTTYQWRVRSMCTGGASLYSTIMEFSTYPDECYAGVRVAALIWLDGAYDQSTQMMRDDLRLQGLVPLTEPYTAMGYNVEGPTTTSAARLQETGAHAVVDWVLIELRPHIDATNVLSTRAGLLLRNGSVVDPMNDQPLNMCLPQGDYYVSVRHRNHLPCMTASPISHSPIGTLIDLRSTAQATYGANARRVQNNIARLWAGNSNHDGSIKYTGAANDRDPLLSIIGGTSPTTSVSGYLDEDLNLDGLVKYTGASNDRDLILTTIGGVVLTNVRNAQLP